MRLIAHRGASGHAPENTMAAFRLALEMGAGAIEFDVHQTADRRLVVLHDNDLRRVARRRAKVRDLTWKELREFDVGSWFAPAFSTERVPALEDVFDLAQGRAELHLEIKKGSRLYPGIEERVARFIADRRAWSTTVVSSFDHAALYRLRALEPRLRLAYLLGLTRLKTAWRETGEIGAESLNLSVRQARAPVVKAAHARRMGVLVYTVNAEKQARRLRALGVDGVFSNFPEMKA